MERASARASLDWVDRRSLSISRRSWRTTARNIKDEPMTSRKSWTERTLACCIAGAVSCAG
jgi:hypothetical protein